MRELVVQKFGGSSLATTERIGRVADRIAQRRRRGPVVVVASAMGGRTDALVQLAAGVTEHPPAREIDALLATGEGASTALLAMALEARGVPARSLRGWQAGVYTSGPHGHARIGDVDPDPVRRILDEGAVPVVAGFQGLADDGAIATLGRGGSDTTAVALAAELGARCEILSDVCGVYSADPRDVPTARRIPHLSYDEMIALAAQGASVLNDDSVRFAQRAGVVVHAAATFEAGEGTTVSHRGSDAPFAGVAGRDDVAELRGDATLVREAAREHHLVAMRRAGDQAHALVVLCEGVPLDSFTDVSAKAVGSTAAIVGRGASDAHPAVTDLLGAVPLFGGRFALTGIVPRRQDAMRQLHAALIDAPASQRVPMRETA